MLPTTTNHHSLIEPSWKSYYDAKKLIRQTEQRLQDATTRGHQPFTSHHHHHHYEIGAATGDDSNLLSPSSSFLLHGDSSSIHAGNRSMLGDERSSSTTTTSKHQLLDSEALQTIRRKISKQKIAAERRAEQLLHSQSDAGHMFESYRSRNPHHNYSTSASLQNLHYSPQRHQHTSPLNHHHHHHHPVPLPSSHLSQSQSFPTELDAVLRHSAGSRMLHGDNDAIRSNDFDRQTFHQPNTRKITKIMPKENYSLSNGRPPPQQQQRSASASTGPANKYHDLPSSHFLTPNEVQRLKHVRRLEPAHVPSVPGAKTSLITPESWRADHPVSTTSKKVIPQEKMTTTKKSTATEIMIKRTKTDEPREEPTVHVNQRTEKPIKAKRDTSVPKSAEKTTPAKAPPKPKTESEKKRIQDYMLHKRQQHEEALVSEKRSRNEQEKVRREKLKKLNEQIKEVVHQPPILPSKKPSAFTPVTPKDLTEQTRQRLLRLLGPKNISESSPVEFEQSQRVLERSPSSSSLSSSSSSLSSNNSVIEVQPATRPFEPFSIRSRSEPPGHNGITSNGHRRHETLLNWAGNLTRDCDQIENKFKSFRPDGTQPFDIIPPARQQLQHDDGNLRHPIYLANNESDIVPPLSTSLRPSGRLSRLNQNRTTEYQGQQLPGVGDLRDPLLERRIYRDRAAAKIQAAYRGYTVRKSLQWSNDHRRLQSEFNKRPLYKPIARPFSSDLLGSTHVNIDFRFSDDNFTIGSTLLRRYEQNGSAAIPSMNPSESRSIIVPHHHRERQQTTTRKPTALNSYSDDYENGTSTTSSAISTPISHKQPSIVTQKPRVIPQPVPKNVSASSSSSSSSSSSTTPTPTPIPEPRVPSLGQHRRSISPPLAPQMSPDNGRLLQPPPPPSTVQHRIFDERRYSPDALERQLNAEFHLLDGVEASMKQVDNMERLRSVALAQQEVVSLAQIMKNTPPPPSSHQLQTRKSPVRQTSSTSSSSSSSTNRKRRSPSPPQAPPSVTPHTHARHRITQNSSPPTSSSESILTAREKRVRQKFNSEVELQAYEKRLKDIEKKIRQLVKRAFEIFDEKRSVSSPPTLLRTKPVVPITNTVPTHVRSKSSNHSSDDSTISEEVPGSHKSSSSTSSAVQRKTTTAVVNDTSEIRTESNIFPHKKDSDTSSISIRQQQQQSGDIVTSDASDIEHRIRAYREQLKVKKTELERLKQRKNKELLRRQEDELKKQIQSYDNEIETLRLQPSQTPSPSVTTRMQRNEQTVPVPSRPSSSSSSSSSSTAAKPVESSIAEDLPVTTTQSKTGLEEKKVATPPPSPPIVVKAPVKERDFFDDDNEEEEEEERKPVETPRDERDTQHDAQSISIATDLAASSAADTDNENDSRRPSIDNEQPILNFNTNMPTSPTEKAVSKDDANVSSSSSSSETTTSKHSKPSPVPQPAPIQQKPSQPQGRSSSISNDYDEDFSEASHSATNIPTKKNGSNVVDDVDIESIQEDLNESRSTRATNRSSSSKSSGDEQSEILVLVKKSASNTPRRPDDKTVEEELPVPPPPPPLPSLPAPFEEKKVEIEKNDDTSHDASEDEEPIEHEQQETKIDTFTDMFIRTFIDEAIDEGKKIQRLKREKIPVNTTTTTTTTPSHLMTKEASEWMSDEDLSDEENNRHTPGQEEDVENDMQILTSQPDFLKQLDTTTNGTAEHDDLKLDLSRLDDKTLDEPRIESPRKLVIEEPVKPVVPHTRDQVLELSHRATTILFDQNRNFADRSTINRSIPESYFPEDQQDSDSEDIRRSRRAYAVMVFDLCVELLHEMYTPNVRQAKYEWQKAQLVSKRYYRANPPQNRVDAERFVQDKVLEILNLAPRQVTYSKWRTPPVRRGGGDQFEVVLDEELRRMEPHWINYDNDCLQIKFDIADIIFDQLFQETLTECLQVVKKRMLQSSSSTRL